MATVHIPRSFGRFGGIVIPQSRFNGQNVGLGVVIGRNHPNPRGVEVEAKRAGRSFGAEYAGRLSLPDGDLLGFSMPEQPAKMFISMGLSPSAVRTASNAIDLTDDADITARWTAFADHHAKALDDASPDQRASMDRLSPQYLPQNVFGSDVVARTFGRTFERNGVSHAAWERHQDGFPKASNGRASLFLMAETDEDWHFLARGLLGRLHADPDVRISTADLTSLLDVAVTEDGPAMSLDGFREVIEAEAASVRSDGTVTGRSIAEHLSVGFPPHEFRGGRRLVMAQFSTPPAIGEAAEEFLKPAGRHLLEPSIGNGVLAAASYHGGGLITGIELDPGRASRVAKALGDAQITLADALNPNSYPSSIHTDGYDAVLANPPYMKLDKDTDLGVVHIEMLGQNFRPKTAETRIAALSLNSVRAGGNAVLVMPSEMMHPDQITGHKREFYALMESMFDRVSTIGLDAHLYKGMGANFPVQVHFLEGRFADGQGRSLSEASRMVPDEIVIATTFDRFYEKFDGILAASRIEPLSEAEVAANRSVFLGRPVEEIEPTPETTPGGANMPQDGASVPEDDEPSQGPSSGPSSGGKSDRSRPPFTPDNPASDTDQPEAEPISDPEEPELEEPAFLGGDDDLVRPADMPTSVWFVDDFSPDPFTVPYVSFSSKPGARTVIERTMEHETYSALKEVVSQFGSVDGYVARKLGISEEHLLSDDGPLSPEQIDSLAISFSRRERGRASIVGDQMGVGKGRQLAAHAYSSLLVEGRPVLFMSNRPNLFTDFALRDFSDVSGRAFMDFVNENSIRPFIFNVNDGALISDGQVKFKTGADEHREAKNNGLGDHNLLMMSYSQVQIASGLWRASAIKDWMTRMSEQGTPPVLLLDEVHKAAGPDSRTGLVIQDMIETAIATNADIVYSSATSVKSGRNLPVYRPALPDTGLSNQELMLAIERMPLAMQEILSAEMARSGSLIERKMSEAGVERDLVVLGDIDSVKMEGLREKADAVSERLREMMAMAPVIAEAAKEQFKDMVGGSVAAGSADKLRVETTSPASQLDAFSRYLMASIKGAFTRELIEDSVAAGEKPTVVCEFTADSVSRWMVGSQLPMLNTENGIEVDAHPNIGHVLKRFADRMLTFKGSTALGDQIETRVIGFDGWLEEFGAQIDLADLAEMRVNIFDRAREACETLNMTFDDISGRSIEFRTGEDGKVRAFKREAPNSIEAAAAFNRGDLDVLGFNDAAATGISLQNALRNGPDVRRRSMIKLAYQREITNERQVEGRINRTGQLSPPRYLIPVTGMAADDRIANLFNRANRSLTSSTSATRESSTSAEHAVDILNSVGEMAVAAVLNRNPDVAEVLDINPETLDLPRKLLGRSVMLPLDQQSNILADVDATFHLTSERLTQQGANPLRLGRYNWNATVELHEVLKEGDPNGTGIAAQPLVVNAVKFKEEIQALSPNRVLEHTTEYIQKRKTPFLSLQEEFDYAGAHNGGRYDLKHSLFSSVTGRSKEQIRYLFPIPIPKNAANELLNGLNRKISEATRKKRDGATISTDEIRDLSEELETEITGQAGSYRYKAIHSYIGDVRSKVSDKAANELRFAMPARAMRTRAENISRLTKIADELVVGRMVAVDRRAIPARIGGSIAEAYERVGAEGGLIPALVTSGRFDEHSPFSESKMQFSLFIPGSRGVESVTVSSLYSGMEASGAGLELPIQHIEHFARGLLGQYSPEFKEAMIDVLGDDSWNRLIDTTYPFLERDYEQPRNNRSEGMAHILDLRTGAVVGKGAEFFRALNDAMPSQALTKTRFTLEGDLFSAMALVANQHGNAAGEKVIYTDSEGTNRNAILLNPRKTKELLAAVRKKAERRSQVHPGLKTEEAFGHYMALTNTVLHGFPDQWSEQHRPTGEPSSAQRFANALAFFYPDQFGSGIAKERVIRDPERVLNEIRDRLSEIEGTYPASILAGGDIWRWAADHAAREATLKAGDRGKRKGTANTAGTSGLSLIEVPDADGTVIKQPRESHGLAGISGLLSSMDRQQMAVLMFTQGSVGLVFKKDFPGLSDMPDADALMDRSRQELPRYSDGSGDKLTKGLLAVNLSISDSSDMELLGRVMSHASRRDHGEILVGGIMKSVQSAIDTMASDRGREAALTAERDRPASVSRDSGPSTTGQSTPENMRSSFSLQQPLRRRSGGGMDL